VPPADPIKVYDARWEVHEFDDVAIRRLFEAALAYGQQQGVDTLVLTRDARISAGHVQELALETALGLGWRVVLCPDPISTPQGYFAALRTSQTHPGTMGLFITASHNPSSYVGVKFTMPVVRAIALDCGPEGGLTRIREIYHSGERFEPAGGGTLTIGRFAEEYVEFSMGRAGVRPGDLNRLRVVLDTFNGSAGAELYQALTQAGATVYPLRLVPDGQFPTGSPNPTSHGKMFRAIELAARVDAHAVIGTDGDGDRIVFGDRRGLISAGLAAFAVLRAGGLDGRQSGSPAVLHDPKISPRALARWHTLGVRPVLFRNGHSQIKDHMRHIDAVAAAEESGHFYHRITLGDLAIAAENSILSVLLFLRAIRDDPALMDDLWSTQKLDHCTGEFNYEFPSDSIRDQAIAAVVRHFAGQGFAQFTATPDGDDLEGTVLRRGVRVSGDRLELEPDWISGFMRIATTERGVVRSYFCSGERDEALRVEAETRRILAEDFAGQVIE
jgi:phosphomannomutase